MYDTRLVRDFFLFIHSEIEKIIYNFLLAFGKIQ
jgi:hypothetical protein